MAELETPTVSCDDWYGHAAHHYDHEQWGPVRCPGHAFDWPPEDEQ